MALETVRLPSKGTSTKAHLHRCAQNHNPHILPQYAPVAALRAPRIWTFVEVPRNYEFF